MKISNEVVIEIICNDCGLIYKNKKYFSCKMGGYKGLKKEWIKDRVEKIWKEFNVDKKSLYVKEGVFDYGNYVVGNRYVDNKLMVGCEFVKMMKNVDNCKKLIKLFDNDKRFEYLEKVVNEIKKM